MNWHGIVGLSLASTVVCIVGCGPDIEVQTVATSASGSSTSGDMGGNGGSGGIGSGGGGAGGGASLCGSIFVQPTVIAMTALQQFSPRIGLNPATGQVVYAFLNGLSGSGSSLYSMSVNAFDAWPPIWSPAILGDMAVQSFAMGDGAKGPIAIVRHVNAPPRLIDSFVPQVNFANIPLTDDGDPLFVAGIDNRYLWGNRFDTGMYDVLHLGSFQPGSIPQSEDPLVCTKPRLRAIAHPSPGGFVAALLEPNAVESCDPGNPQIPSSVSIVRYDSDDTPGSPLKQSPGWRFDFGEPVVNLSLARTSDGGAWVVFQSDGSTAEVIPPAMAARLTPSGYAVGDGAADPISPYGVILPALVTATMGDVLAASWIDAIDPSAPVIIIQLHELGQALGPSVAIPTNDAWYDGDLQILASSEKRSLLLAWTSKSITAFTRVDCLP